jgi:riboflavin biosynthesis pyrimidine reductase
VPSAGAANWAVDERPGFRLGRALLHHDLVGELRLVVFPVVLGAGEGFFEPTTARRPLRLTGTRVIGEQLVLLTYRVRNP